jgi:hypothetical protein
MKNKKYPYLGIGSEGSVVWFTEPDVGYAIKHDLRIGTFYTEWSEREFKKFSLRYLINKLFK